MVAAGGEKDMSLEAVIFDMDGVLADTEPLHAAAYVRTFAEFGLKIGPEEFHREVTVKGRMVADWFRDLGGRADRDELYNAKDRHYAEVSEDRNIAREGLFHLLDDIQRHGVAMAVATAARRQVAQRLLERLSLGRYFAGVVGLEDVSRTKPDPEVYVKAVSLVGVRAAGAVALEDVPKGVAAARAAGLVAVAVPTAATAALDFRQAHMVAGSLNELSFSRLAELVRSCRTTEDRGD